MNCMDGKYIKMPYGLNQMLFSGCEDVSLTNWKGEYNSVQYDEIWVYSDNNAKVEVYWNQGRFVLQIGYYLDDGFINFIRDRLYYESHPQSKNC